MDLFSTLRTRRSVRRFSAQGVGDDTVRQLLEAAHWAPSAHNKQPWYFIVSRDQEKKEAVAQASRWAKFLPEAPVAIVVCSKTDFEWKSTSPKWVERFSIQSSAAAIQNLLLAAHGLGLAACWIGDMDGDLVGRLYPVPEGYEPVAIIALGYPAGETGREPVRRPLEEVVSWEE